MTADITGRLQGRRVVVTRAADRADALASLLMEHGAIPVVVPLIEIVPDHDGVVALREVLADARSFDWLVVTSPNAAAIVIEHSTGTLPTRIAAIGASTAAVLRAQGLEPTLVPERQLAAGLVEVFPNGPGRVLVVQALDGAATLGDGLRAKGWEVVAVRPYRSVPTSPTAEQRTAVSGADAVLFASGSAARGWVEVFGTDAPPVVVVIGPETASATERAGLRVTSVAHEHSLAGLVQELADFFTARP